DNGRWWLKIENAKRRLVSQLLSLGLPVKSKVSEDPERGFMFDFLRSPEKGPRVLTGHANGLITLNVEEAGDSKREKIRHDLHEPYRTLLGHFRHEEAAVEAAVEPFSINDLYDPSAPDAQRVVLLVNSWVQLTTVLNERARSMGQHDFYPFVMSRPVLRKMHFIQMLVKATRGGQSLN